jgi:hypothetical protein
MSPWQVPERGTQKFPRSPTAVHAELGSQLVPPGSHELAQNGSVPVPAVTQAVPAPEQSASVVQGSQSPRGTHARARLKRLVASPGRSRHEKPRAQSSGCVWQDVAMVQDFLPDPSAAQVAPGYEAHIAAVVQLLRLTQPRTGSHPQDIAAGQSLSSEHPPSLVQKASTSFWWPWQVKPFSASQSASRSSPHAAPYCLASLAIAPGWHTSAVAETPAPASTLLLTGTLVHANPALSAQSEWWAQVMTQAPPTQALPAGQLVAVQLALDFELLPQPAPPTPIPTRMTTTSTARPIVDRNAWGRANRVTLDTSLPAFPKLGSRWGWSQPFDMPQPSITVTCPRQNR